MVVLHPLDSQIKADFINAELVGSVDCKPSGIFFSFNGPYLRELQQATRKVVTLRMQHLVAVIHTPPEVQLAGEEQLIMFAELACRLENLGNEQELGLVLVVLLVN